MRTRKIIGGLVCSLFFPLLYFFYAENKLEQKSFNIQTLPDIRTTTISGDSLTLCRIQNGHMRTAVLFFSPDCEFCQQEIKGITNRHAECRNVQWVFYTLAQPEELRVFLKEYPVQDIPNSFVIREDWPNVYKQLSLSNPPELIVYDENGKLMLHHKGATSIKTIVEELQ